MASAAAATAASRRAAAAPSMTLWSTFSVAKKLVRILNVRVSSAATRGIARPTVRRLVWPRAMMPVNWSIPKAPRFERVDGGEAPRSSGLRRPDRALSTAAFRALARPALSRPSTSWTTGITTPWSVATARPTSSGPGLPHSRKPSASARRRVSVKVGIGSEAPLRKSSRVASMGSASTSRVTAK